MDDSRHRTTSANQHVHALDRLDIVDVERAAMDLRRGLPVVVTAPDAATLAVSAERLEPPALDYLKTEASGEPHVVLTHPRAATLAIRLYTEDVVALPWRSEMDSAAIRRLADPAFDLDAPLRGPFAAARTLPAAHLVEAVRITKIAGLLPALVAAPLAGDGARARNWAAKERLSICDAAAVRAYDLALSDNLTAAISAQLPLADAPDTRLTAFRSVLGGPEHYAIIIGDPVAADKPLVRLHSECFTGDLLASLKCDCGDQLRGAIRRIAEDGAGVVLYLAQEGRGIGLMNKLRAYALQDQGFDTVEANERLGFGVDERAFEPAARVLSALGLSQIRLLTNNPAKVAALDHYGIKVVERVGHAFPANPHNADYLRVKAEKTGHYLPRNDTDNEPSDD